MRERIEHRLIALYASVLLVLIAMAFAAVRNIKSSVDATDWVNHTHALILEADGLVASMHAGEAALRGYLITGDLRDQTAYREAYAEMAEHYEVLKALGRNEGNLAKQIVALEEAIQRRLDLANLLVRTRTERGDGAVRELIAPDSGGEVVRQIERAVRKLKDEQREALQARDREAFRQAQTTRWVVTVGVVANFLLMGWVFWLIVDDLAARRRAARVLEEANALLEEKVRARTAELVRANENLRSENLERRWSNETLQHQVRYNRLIVDAIGDSVLVVTRQRNVLRCNPAVTHLTDFAPTELIGGSVAKVLVSLQSAAGPGENESAEVVWNRVLKEGRDAPEQAAIFRAKSGSRIAVRLHLFPVRDNDKVVGAVLVARNVPSGPEVHTDPKQACAIAT